MERPHAPSRAVSPSGGGVAIGEGGRALRAARAELHTATGRRKTKIAGRIVMKNFEEGTRAFGLLRFTALAIPLCVLVGAATSRAQDAGQLDDWKVDPLRGPVDLGLTDPALVGAIDVHVHLDPDAPGPSGVIRALDIFDAVALAKARGMRGFVFKTHQNARSPVPPPPAPPHLTPPTPVCPTPPH